MLKLKIILGYNHLFTFRKIKDLMRLFKSFKKMILSKNFLLKHKENKMMIIWKKILVVQRDLEFKPVCSLKTEINLIIISELFLQLIILLFGKVPTKRLTKRKLIDSFHQEKHQNYLLPFHLLTRFSLMIKIKNLWEVNSMINKLKFQ